MTPLKTSFLTFVILVVFCQCIAAFYPSRPKECCYSYKKGGPIQIPQISRYYRTPSDCSLDAVVFVMKTKKTLCVNPRLSWVKTSIRILDKKK